MPHTPNISRNGSRIPGTNFACRFPQELRGFDVIRRLKTGIGKQFFVAPYSEMAGFDASLSTQNLGMCSFA